jgi:hypothetical protein
MIDVTVRLRALPPLAHLKELSLLSIIPTLFQKMAVLPAKKG